MLRCIFPPSYLGKEIIILEWDTWDALNRTITGAGRQTLYGQGCNVRWEKKLMAMIIPPEYKVHFFFFFFAK